VTRSGSTEQWKVAGMSSWGKRSPLSLLMLILAFNKYFLAFCLQMNLAITGKLMDDTDTTSME
jgi:hypothetical protein